MWERLGHKPSVALAGWPAVDRKLLVADAITAVVQINGKIKDRLDVAPSITDAELEAQALALPAIVDALKGATIAKIITRAPKIVNIVINS
jgi:leucyl-tRNA synthetase